MSDFPIWSRKKIRRTNIRSVYLLLMSKKQHTRRIQYLVFISRDTVPFKG